MTTRDKVTRVSVLSAAPVAVMVGDAVGSVELSRSVVVERFRVAVMVVGSFGSVRLMGWGELWVEACGLIRLPPG